jgi:hypothetical protein
MNARHRSRDPRRIDQRRVLNIVAEGWGDQSNKANQRWGQLSYSQIAVLRLRWQQSLDAAESINLP